MKENSIRSAAGAGFTRYNWIKGMNADPHQIARTHLVEGEFLDGLIHEPYPFDVIGIRRDRRKHWQRPRRDEGKLDPLGGWSGVYKIQLE